MNRNAMGEENRYCLTIICIQLFRSPYARPHNSLHTATEPHYFRDKPSYYNQTSAGNGSISTPELILTGAAGLLMMEDLPTIIYHRVQVATLSAHIYEDTIIAAL